MKYIIEGASRATAEPVRVVFEAESPDDAERQAVALGVLVASVWPDEVATAASSWRERAAERRLEHWPWFITAVQWVLVLAGAFAAWGVAKGLFQALSDTQDEWGELRQALGGIDAMMAYWRLGLMWGLAALLYVLQKLPGRIRRGP